MGSVESPLYLANSPVATTAIWRLINTFGVKKLVFQVTSD